MTDDAPLTFGEALAAEYRALRPEFAPEGADTAALYAAAHRDSEPLAALCISGGGIRSATFNLGVIQGLARLGLLSRFDLLSVNTRRKIARTTRAKRTLAAKAGKKAGATSKA